MTIIQCSGCRKNFSDRGFSQHIAKTRNPRCQLANAAPRAPPASQSTLIETLSLQDLFTDNTGDVDITMEDSAATAPALSGEFDATLGGILFFERI